MLERSVAGAFAISVRSSGVWLARPKQGKRCEIEIDQNAVTRVYRFDDPRLTWRSKLRDV
jgi:hypothetical protein